jgi:hypothetical protein
MKRNQNTKTRTTASTPSSRSGAASTVRDKTVGDRIYGKLGALGTGVLYRVVATVLLALVIFLDYVLVLFTAVNMLPNVAVLVQQGTGVSLDSRIDAVVAGWLLPVLFIAAALLVAEIVLMRGLWRLVARFNSSIALYLFRSAIEQGQPAPRAATARDERSGLFGRVRAGSGVLPALP